MRRRTPPCTDCAAPAYTPGPHPGGYRAGLTFRSHSGARPTPGRVGYSGGRRGRPKALAGQPALLSDERLAVLRGRCCNEGVEIAPGVTRRWHATGTLLVLVVAAAALLLPLGSTGWLGQALEWFIGLTTRIRVMLLLLFSLLITLLLHPLRFLLKPGNCGSAVLPQRPILDLPTQIEATRRLPDWLGGALFWVVVVLVGDAYWRSTCGPTVGCAASEGPGSHGFTSGGTAFTPGLLARCKRSL